MSRAMYNVALLAHRPPPSDLFLALATRAADHVLIYLACGTVVRGRSARSGFLQLHRHVCHFAQGPPFRMPPPCAPFCKLLLRRFGCILTPTEGCNNLIRRVSFSPVRKCIILRHSFCLHCFQHAKKLGAIYTVCSRPHSRHCWLT